MENDPNTQDGFAAAMRAAEAASVGAEPESPEEGQAAEQEAPAVPVVEEAAPEGGEDEKFQAGYAKALGEQSEKLGEERARREALEARLSALEEPEVVESTGFVKEDDWDELETLYEGRGGAGMMLHVANTRPELIDAALAHWKSQGEAEAFLYETEMQKLEAQIAAQNAPPPERDPALAKLEQDTASKEAMGTITAEFGKERLEAAQPHLEAALKTLPERIQNVLAEDFNSGDAERITDAFRTVFAVAEPLAGAPVVKRAAEQQAASKTASKQAAAVANGSQAGGGQGESETPSTAEEMDTLDPDSRRKAAAKIMGDRIRAQQTSVTAGLTKPE